MRRNEWNAFIVFGVFLSLVVARVSMAQAPEKAPTPAAKIIAPAAQEKLQGVVSVRVAIEAPQPAKGVLAAVDSAPWTRLERVGETNEWTGTLDTRLSPNGPARIVVLAFVPGEKRLARVTAAVPVVLENGLFIYFADLHGHTAYSDGVWRPEDALRYACHEAKLDFFVLTDHLESLDEAEWQDTREQVWKATEEGRFVCVPGLEWTKPSGHACIYDPPTTNWPSDIEGFYRALVQFNCVGKFNHPRDPANCWRNWEYSETGDKAMQLMEVRNLPEEEVFIKALKAGWHLAPEGSSDTHSGNWGRAGTWTGIIAPGLSRRNMMAALRNRHVYSTADRNCRLYFWANAHLMGEIVNEPASRVLIETLIQDPDANDAAAKIVLFEDGEIVASVEPKANEYRWRIMREPAPGTHFYFVRVTQEDGNLLWSAPVWLTVAASPLAAPTP